MPKHSVSFLQRFLYLLNPTWDIRTGVVLENGRRRYVRAARRGNAAPRVIELGEDFRNTTFGFFPTPLNTTLTDTVALFVHEPLQYKEPEQWLESNEKRLIPAGMPSERIQNEWDIFDDSIISVTVNKESLEQFSRNFPKGQCVIGALSAPLWDLALLYSRHIGGPFIIWKLCSWGSVFGLVKNGKLSGVCHFWVSIDDITSNRQDIGPLLSGILKSLSGMAEFPVVIPYCPDHAEILASLPSIPGAVLQNPPAIENVPPGYHEAYACAIHEETRIDFASFADSQHAKQIAAGRRLSGHVVRKAGFAAALLFLLGALGIAGWGILGSVLESKLAPVRKDIEALEKVTTQVDSLGAGVKRIAAFSSRESIVTRLLSDLQLAFPEGLWAEQILISETAGQSWQVEIVAQTNSTGSIPVFVKNLGAIDGVGNVRMIYSEKISQNKASKDQKQVRFKIECSWGSAKGGSN